MIQKTTVANKKAEPFDVNIQRPTVFGNPYIVGIHGTREECIDKFLRRIIKDPRLPWLLDRLRGKRLGCGCKPLRCHGDIWAELADKMKQEDNGWKFNKTDLVKVIDRHGNIRLERVQDAEGSIAWIHEAPYWRDTGFRIGRTGDDDPRRIETCSDVEAELFG